MGVLTEPRTKKSFSKAQGLKRKSSLNNRRAISLFAGAGGMDVGLKKQAFRWLGLMTY